jgi:hypothetical protein
MADLDGDRSPTWHEFFAGTDPTNDLSVFMVSDVDFQSESNAVISWLSVSGKTYSVQCSTNLVSGEWETVAGGVEGMPPMNVVTVQVANSELRVYRLIVE